MRARAIAWVGTRTSEFEATRAFFSDRLGLELEVELRDFAMFRLPNGDRVEVFGPSLEGQDHFTTGPVAEFLVDDIPAARAELEAAGVEFFGPTGGNGDGIAWAHFRGPDGCVYGLTEDHHHPLSATGEPPPG